MKNNIKKLSLIFAFSICSMILFAANPNGQGDLSTMDDPAAAPGDPGVSPINDYIVPMLILGIALSYHLLKKKMVNRS